MKTATLDTPVMSDWFDENGQRLDSKPYLSGAIEAKALLRKLSVKQGHFRELQELTLGGKEGLVNAGRIPRRWVDAPDYGTPFLSSTDILQADLSNVSLIARSAVRENPKLIIHKGWTLITRSGSIGRMAYTRPDMDGMACTEDVLRVVPDPDKIRSGYLYAYLSSKFGIPQVVAGTYGAIIQHIEPYHIAGLMVPRLENDVEQKAHEYIAEAARLRTEYQKELKAATDTLFGAFGLHDITPYEWHKMGPDLGFAGYIESSETLRAVNFNPRMQSLFAELSMVNHTSLGDICKDGMLRRGFRFKRMDCEPEFGVKLVGQKELFWVEPDGRWIIAKNAPDDIFVENETILITSQGSIGKAEFVTGSFTKYAYTEHFLRVRSGNPSISNAFLFAFLRSEMAYRCLNSLCVGSIQQDMHRALLVRFPVPIPPETVRHEVETLVRDAYKKRHEALRLEKEAITMVENWIEKEARWQPSLG